MEWLSLIGCPTCSGTIRHDGEGMFRCSGCNANYPAAGSVPDFIAREGDIAAPGIELDYDYHLRRHHGSLRGLYNRFCRSLELQLIKREADRLGRSIDMLDVGCGNPTRSNTTYHAQLFPLARLYLGVEPSLPLACRVHPLPSVGLVRASGELRVLKDRVVDMAMSFRALDRCADPDRTLANMAAALRPGGRILISLVNKNIWYGARPIACAVYWPNACHPKRRGAARKCRQAICVAVSNLLAFRMSNSMTCSTFQAR